MKCDECEKREAADYSGYCKPCRDKILEEGRKYWVEQSETAKSLPQVTSEERQEKYGY